jgi:cell division septum initiation protein DivIVA
MDAAFERQPVLPTGFRGYKRADTDAFLSLLEESHAGVVAERDELRRQVAELTRELDRHRGREQAVADALVTAQLAAEELRTTAAAEIEQERREAAEERARLAAEGSAIRAKARQEATEIVREARIRGDRLIGELVTLLQDHQRETDEFLTGTREKLETLVQDLLARMPGSAPPQVDYPERAAEDPPAADAAVA